MLTNHSAMRAGILALSMLGAASPALAQNSPAPQLVPGLEHFSLPGTPAPRPVPPPVVRTVPTPHPTPTPRPTPRPRATTTPRVMAPEVATPRPLPAAPVHVEARPPLAAPTVVTPPVPLQAPQPTPTPTPTPASTPASPPVIAEPAIVPPVPAPEQPERRSGLPLWQAVIAVAVGVGVVLLLGWLSLRYWRRWREGPEEEEPPHRTARVAFDLGARAPENGVDSNARAPTAEPEVETGPIAVPQAIEGAAPVGRARLEIELRLKRAGTNLLSAAVEYEIVIGNAGDVAATGAYLGIHLLTAGPAQDDWIRGWFAQPIEKPVAPPFDLPPGATAALDGMAMMPKEAVAVMKVEGKALFVPVVAINLLYEWDGGTGQTAASWVVGIDRGEDVRMAPFRLDGPPRMHSDVRGLSYTIAVQR